MCEITEKWLKEGELIAKKETAYELADEGFAFDRIARILKLNVKLITKWMDERMLG